MNKKKFTIEFDIDNFTSFQKKKGWNESETAEKLNISPEQLWKIKKGKHNPGQDFIAGTLTAFPTASFDDFFILPNSLRERKIINA
jgi:transcriptional regulator with XRE-family HTH domain